MLNFPHGSHLQRKALNVYDHSKQPLDCEDIEVIQGSPHVAFCLSFFKGLCPFYRFAFLKRLNLVSEHFHDRSSLTLFLRL